VLRLVDIDRLPLARLLASYGIELTMVDPGADIPGSYWGDSEAGLLGDRLLARPDTPLHSVLHEASHYICATAVRRAKLARDAGGDDAEESAVCFLQILLADRVREAGRERLMQDMDSWGYSFRLGSTAAWFQKDAADALAWLQQQTLVDAAGHLTGALRC
jgi:hypothetical protein